MAGNSGNQGRVTLREWRVAEGLSAKKTAERLSAIVGRTVHAQSVLQWEAGVMPHADTAEAVRWMTNGRVGVESFGRRGR